MHESGIANYVFIGERNNEKKRERTCNKQSEKATGHSRVGVAGEAVGHSFEKYPVRFDETVHCFSSLVALFHLV